MENLGKTLIVIALIFSVLLSVQNYIQKYKTITTTSVLQITGSAKTCTFVNRTLFKLEIFFNGLNVANTILLKRFKCKVFQYNESQNKKYQVKYVYFPSNGQQYAFPLKELRHLRHILNKMANSFQFVIRKSVLPFLSGNHSRSNWLYNYFFGCFTSLHC